MVVTEEVPKVTEDDTTLLEQEVNRLYEKLGKLGWSKSACESIAPYTLKINTLKEEKGFKILDVKLAIRFLKSYSPSQ